MRWMTAVLIGLMMLTATVTSASGEAPATPVPPACNVEHRTAAAIVESAGPEAGSLPIPDPIPYLAPDGQPADAATAERVTALVHGLIGCVNSGDVIGFMSLLSDDFLRRHFAAFALSPEDLADFSPQPMTDEERVSLVEIRDITVLADGRIAVLVLLDQGDRASPELTSALTLTDSGGRLVIDEWQPVTIGRGGTAWQTVVGDGYRGVIVPADEVAGYLWSLSGVTVQGAWMPTPEQIATLEASLSGFLRVAPGAAPDLADRVRSYDRHYAGYVADGRALILVNAFCEPVGSADGSEPVIVMDGGDCFFHVAYDPTSGAFEDLSINGEA